MINVELTETAESWDWCTVADDRERDRLNEISRAAAVALRGSDDPSKTTRELWFEIKGR